MKKNILIKTLAIAICACMVAGNGIVAFADSSYTVKRGDSLWKIAKEMLGDGAKYNKIYDANKDTTPVVLTNPTPQPQYTNISGKYVQVYSEEIGGKTVELMNIVELKADGTCTVAFQDTVAGKWDGNKISLNDGNVFEFKIENGNLILNQNGVWKQYATIISQLKPGQAYGFAAINPNFDVLLVSEDGAYDYGNGIMAVYDGCLMICNNMRTMMEYIDSQYHSMITRKVVEKSYDANGKAAYSYMDADTQKDGVLDNDSMMQEMFDMYSKATVVNFTVVK